jgi:hypothetical protein
LRAEAKKPIKSRKTGAKLYANTVSNLLVVHHSSANDSFHNFKEITKTLANPVFTRVFLMFAFWEKVAEKWSIFDGSTQI